jgi:hypothetical protein
LMLFTVTNILLQESYGTKKYNFLTKTVDIRADSPYSHRCLQVFKTAIYYVPIEHTYRTLSLCWLFRRAHHDHRDCFSLVRLARTQASNLPYSVRN